MSKSKLCIIVLALVVVMLGAVQANAQYTPAENFYTAGSSAQFNTFGVAAIGTSNNGICGQHHWTGKSGGKAYQPTSSTQNGTYSITLVDPRSGSILAEPANLWVAWDNNAVNQVSGNGVVCFYASVDSIVGVRAYAARAYLSISSNASGATDASTNTFGGATVVDQVPLVGAGEPLPAVIYNIINNAVLNAANTDIRPEDAKFATMRALTTLGSQVTGRGVTGWGYGPSPIGTAILSSQSSTIANPVDFTLDCSDTDPVNSSINAGCGGGSTNIREYFEVPIGAAPVMIVANVSNTGSGHLGDGHYSNINRFVLRNVLEGTLPYVRDIGYNTTYNAGPPTTWTTTEAAVPLNVFVREPLSGTYNTTEWSVPMSLEMDGSQYHPGFVVGMETGVTPTDTTPVCGTKPFTAANCSTSSGNPLWMVNSVGGFRGRAVGTGEMITAVNGNADTIGFAFWGFSTYQGKANIKYLSVDGVDPLYSGPSSNPGGVGVFPSCTTNSNGYATACPNLSFPNIVNGSYPIWSNYRLIWDPFTSSTNIAPYVVAAAQTASDPSTGLVTDFVPVQYMQTFHSHYTQVVSDSGAAYGGNNGFKTAENGESQLVNIPETGGDMGGAVLTIQSEVDYLLDTGGNQQVGQFQ
jgi:hypothetical protein